MPIGWWWWSLLGCGSRWFVECKLWAVGGGWWWVMVMGCGGLRRVVVVHGEVWLVVGLLWVAVLSVVSCGW